MADKRKKAAYFAKCASKKSRMDYSLQPGLRGFIATCNFREKDCVREAMNLLNEFADRIYGEDKQPHSDTEPKNKKIVFDDSENEEEEKDDDDIEAALAQEVNALKKERQSSPSQRRFQVVQSGADNCVFIRTTVEDPVSLVVAVLKDIELQSKQKTRFLLRLLPVEATCKAWPDDIKTASGKLLDKYFKGEPKSFCVVFKRRNNSNVLREELIDDLASEIKLRNPLHKADMKQPDLAVIVEVIRNICCIAVVPNYYQYRKYNLLEVAKMKANVTNQEEDLGKGDALEKPITEMNSKESLTTEERQVKVEESEACSAVGSAESQSTNKEESMIPGS